MTGNGGLRHDSRTSPKGLHSPGGAQRIHQREVAPNRTQRGNRKPGDRVPKPHWEYVSSSSTDACPYRSGAAAILEEWAKGTRFYDPVRAVDRDAGRRGLVDGSELLRQIREQQLDQRQTFMFEKFRKRLVGELNALLVEPPSANSIESSRSRRKGEAKRALRPLYQKTKR